MTMLDDYVARTPRSRALFERATASLPGGSTRTTVFSAPYPPYVASGSGLWIEYDNTAGGNHVHSVLRRPSADFGSDLLAAHRRAYHSRSG